MGSGGEAGHDGSGKVASGGRRANVPRRRSCHEVLGMWTTDEVWEMTDVVMVEVLASCSTDG